MTDRTVGQYRILSKIGAGGMGEVFLAEDSRLGRKAAIKFLPAEVATDPGRRRRFVAEARAASALNHPHVCVIYDVGETDENIPYIAMEFIEGDSLCDVLTRCKLEIPQILDIAIQVADALDAAHSNRIVHRDIKPANISLNDRGQVKVLDFGLAKRLPTESIGVGDSTTDLQQTQMGEVLGTPTHMSPEQALGREVDHRTDIFSMGVVLYRMTTGQLPFEGSTLAELLEKINHSQPTAIARLNYDVPAELERITMKCLQKSPDRRYQSARELMIDLKNLARELELGTTATGQASNRREVTQAFSHSPMDETPAERRSIEDIRGSDVLLNYAAIDDRPLLDGKRGWVSQLHHNLEVRMEQLSGARVNIARLPESSESEPIEGELLELLPRAKAMISVVSPPFIKSENCRKEVERFWLGAQETGGQWVDERARLLKVLKTAILEEETPEPLADIFSPLFGFEFFERDSNTGRIREFDETFGPALKQRFFERVYDLAFDTCQLLKAYDQVRSRNNLSSASSNDRQYIYLATTTSDVQHERDRIKRELLERGHIVFPDAPLPMRTQDVEMVVRQCLEKCTMAIHLLGKHYGVTPEDSSESVPALQVRLTADWAREKALQRLVWFPGELLDDDRQRQFVSSVQEDPALQYGAEIIEGNLNLLKKDLIRRLSPPEEKPKQLPSAKASEGAPKLYLICDPQDETQVEALEDYLFEQGLEVWLPAFDGDDTAAAELHHEHLVSCDAALVYYGAAPKAWVDIKLRELLKAAGYDREKPIAVQAVYVAPPDDRRKERYRSHHALVIRQETEAVPTSQIDAFIEQVKEKCV